MGTFLIEVKMLPITSGLKRTTSDDSGHKITERIDF